MTKLANKKEHLSSLIEGAVIAAGDDGITANKIMKMFKIGITCARNHLSALENTGRVYRVRRSHPNAGGQFCTFHAGEAALDYTNQPARRDWLQVAFFGATGRAMP
jgi:hypothetical protein